MCLKNLGVTEGCVYLFLLLLSLSLLLLLLLLLLLARGGCSCPVFVLAQCPLELSHSTFECSLICTYMDGCFVFINSCALMSSTPVDEDVGGCTRALPMQSFPRLGDDYVLLRWQKAPLLSKLCKCTVPFQKTRMALVIKLSTLNLTRVTETTLEAGSACPKQHFTPTAHPPTHPPI